MYCCRVRQAVKIAVSADTKHLQGERVKFDAVEDRLCDILSGGAPMSQVPDTVSRAVQMQGVRRRHATHFGLKPPAVPFQLFCHRLLYSSMLTCQPACLRVFACVA